jgi:Ca2+-transporting ATPase
VLRLWLPAGRYRVEGEGLDLDGAFRREGDGDGEDGGDGEQVSPTDEAPLRAALEVGVLCNNAALEPAAEDGDGDDEGAHDAIDATGDPLEVALLVAGVKAGLRRSELLEQAPEEREEAFDRETQMMATFHRLDGRFRVAVMGAGEKVLEAATSLRTADGREELTAELRERWLERNRRMAADGLRVLALAEKETGSAGDDPYRELTFLGLVGLRDPPRREVRPALDACRRAGVRVVMVTGDQPATAAAIAGAVGLVPEDEEVRTVVGRDLRSLDETSEEEREELRRVPIFARVDPAQKLDLIALHQEAGEIVAMTGDGVNDAPALKKADIGIAMGRRGTQVAQEAADMVLRDDAFASIVAAVEQGRVIFGNIRRFVRYLLSCNVSEIMIVAGATAVDAPLPILPLQILFLNLVTDVFPALALAFGEGEKTVMERPPRDPDEPVLARRHWLGILGYGLLITLSVLAALFLAMQWLGFHDRRAVTVSFLTLALAQLWNVFTMRDRGSHPLANDVVRNPWVWGALGLCIGLVLAAVYLPGLAGVLGVLDPGARGWALALGLSLVPWAVGLVLRSRKPGLATR